MIDYGFGMTMRRIVEEDLQKLFEWRNNPAIWRWCRQNSPLHWLGHLSWYKSQIKNPKISMFAVTDGSWMVGVAGLTDIDLINRRAEFSLYIRPDAHKQGFGEKALKTLFMHGFKDLGLNSIWGETFADNPAYKLFTKKLGMHHEGTRRNFYFRDGHFTDCHLVSITAADFLAKFEEPATLDTQRPAAGHEESPLTPV
jgi:RimJ/RimL family protein N-acetyltransferase